MDDYFREFIEDCIKKYRPDLADKIPEIINVVSSASFLQHDSAKRVFIENVIKNMED